MLQLLLLVQVSSSFILKAYKSLLNMLHYRGTANSLEVERWRSPPGQLANLVMRDLIYSDGQFVTRLTKCSTVT